MNRPKLAVLLKGYPRLSETFIAQELRGLERAGFELALVALRRPTDHLHHPVHEEIKAKVFYLPEYLRDEPARVLRAAAGAIFNPRLAPALLDFLTDLVGDFNRNRIRRFGQALVLAAEWPEGCAWLHAHFIHTPASVAAYASILTGLPWTCSAHAKDIWTSPPADLRKKLGRARWVVTCTRTGYDYLASLAPDRSRVHLSYHGLDLDRFPHAPVARPPRDGSSADDPVTIVSVGRAVPKKGYDTLLRALAMLNPTLSFRLVHVGGGEQLDNLKALTAELGLAPRVSWRGPLPQTDVLELYRTSDIFALACRQTGDGDRDGLPNVIVEACSQALACVSTNISGIPELLVHEENGLLVPPDEPKALATALARLIRDPALRVRLGAEAEKAVRSRFDHRESIRELTALFDREWAMAS
jgi:glycosyltransferase involved in cell wall biosynthesis